MNRVFLQPRHNLECKFFQNENDFKVLENPIKFNSRGNFLILKIEKTNIDTWGLIEKLSNSLNIYENEIGYAGLKDKNATTIQYISIPKKYSKDIKKFRSTKIKILDTFLHNSKLNIGDLISNSFEINLYDVMKEDLYKIQNRVKNISKMGLPNYFGFQRFGKDVKLNINKAKDLLYGDLVIKDKKLEKMLISVYQSDLFNKWLNKRVKLSNSSYSLLDGDVMFDIESNRLFRVNSITSNIQDDFNKHNITFTGLLSGKDVYKASKNAKVLEDKFDDIYISSKGLRRAGVIFIKDLFINYNEDEKKCKLKFTLPKASYATVFIENILN
jgi:tRNA pseudouridine13 synthase